MKEPAIAICERIALTVSVGSSRNPKMSLGSCPWALLTKWEISLHAVSEILSAFPMYTLPALLSSEWDKPSSRNCSILREAPSMNRRLEPAIQPVAWIFLATSFFPTPSSPVRRTGKRESLTSKTKDHRLCISSLFPTIGSNLSEVDNRHSCSAETSRRTPQLAVDPSEKGNPFRKVGKSSSSGKTSPLSGKSSNRVQGRTCGNTAGVR